MKKYKIVFTNGDHAYLVAEEREQAINTFKRLNLNDKDIKLIEEVYELKEENNIYGNV